MRHNFINVVTALSVLALAVSGSATVRHVPADYASIPAAVSVSSPHDTVLVAAGLYASGTISTSIPITIISESGPDLTRIESTGDVVLLNGVQSDTFHLIGFEIASTGGRGIASNFSRFNVRNCTFTHTQREAIAFSGFTGTIRDCRFFETGPHSQSSSCVYVDNLGKTHLERNIFYNLSYPNVFFTTAERVDLVNNTVIGAIDGFHVGNAYGSPGTAYNNIFMSLSGVAISSNFGAGPVIDYNLYFDVGLAVANGSAGSNSLYDDPQLTSPATGDFTPLFGSPVVNAGNPDPLYFDPDGSISDIGAIPAELAFPRAVQLGIEGENRLRVISHTPTFSWVYLDTLAAQGAFQLQVGTDPYWSVVDLWDSGEIYTDDSMLVYGGAPLLDGAIYYFRVRVNNGFTWSDWSSVSFRMNTPPTAPVAVSPDAGVQIPRLGVTLVVNNSTDVESDPRAYEFEIYDDAALTALVWSIAGIPQTPTQTQYGFVPGLPETLDKWWRARSFDGYEYSDWSNVAYFQAMPPFVRMVPSEYATIQSAINAAGPGDTILVAPGDYVENLNFLGKPLTLTSEAGRDLTTIRPANPLNDIIVIDQAQNCVISGFTIRDVNHPASVGIDCIDCELTIRNNLFTNNREAAVWIRDGGSVVAENNEFRANTSGGDAATLLCRGYSRAVVIGNVFRDNVSSWAGGGIHFSSGEYAEVVRNLVLRNGGGTDVGGGIFVSGVDTVLIINNTIDSNAANEGGGIYLTSIARLELQNNNVTRNQGSGVYVVGSPPVISQDYNNVWGNTNLNFAGVAMPPGANNISEDPEYSDIDPLTYGRGIAFGSPCLNAGNPDSQYDDPDGTRNDIGAFSITLELPVADNINFGSQKQLHIVNQSPRFYWTYLGNEAAQTGFEVEVGADEDWTIAENWQSGQILTGDSSIQYAGTPLVDGASYYVRVRLNDGADWGLWLSERFRMNSRPSAPALVSPGQWDTLHYQVIFSTFENSVDAEADTVEYEIELYLDEVLETVVEVQNLEQGDTFTASELWTLLTPGSPYWWRVRAYDGYEFSNWSTTGAFFARAPHEIHVSGALTTISEALGVAGPYDTVRVPPGEYYENLEFDNVPIRLLSDSGAPQTILHPLNSSTAHIWFGNIPADSLEVAGFTFVGGQAGSVIPLNGGSPRIHHNTFRDYAGPANSGSVLHVAHGSPTIAHNVFTNNDGVSCIGIYGGNATILNNTFDRNNGGVHMIVGSATILNNIVTGSSTFGLYGQFTSADYNCLFGNFPNYDQYAGGANDIIASPIYFDGVGGDFRLQPGSPCINSGHPGAEYNDADGSRNDMGAFAAACACGCHADPVCDHQTDILDVAFVIAGAFRGLESILDDYCFAHGETVAGRTDLDCSGATDIVDVVRVIDVAFRGANPATAFCTLCDAP